MSDPQCPGELERYAADQVKFQLIKLDAVLGLLGDALRLKVQNEAASSIDRARQLDWRLKRIDASLARAHEARQVALVLRRVRNHAIRFLLILTISLRLLRLAAQQTRAEALRQGLGSAAGSLVIERSGRVIEEAKAVTDEILASVEPERDEPPLTWRDSWKQSWALLQQLLFMPWRTRQDVITWSAVGRDLADAQDRLFGAATKDLKHLMRKRIASILWGEVQEHWGPTFALFVTVVGLVISWALEQSFTGLKFAVILGLLIWLAQPLAERWFKRRHLQWYRDLCRRTAHALFLSEVYATCSMVGLERIANSKIPEPQADSSRPIT